MLRLIVLTILCLNSMVSSRDYLEVNITQGTVRGYKSSEGIYEFYGIPYATAPTGAHKFKAPLAPPAWSTTFEAKQRGIACPQRGALAQTNLVIREDCLIMNIFVPDIKENNLPVVVYIHGGGYEHGYGEIMSPKQLVKSNKIIALNFNYRLGVHGFLCLGTKDIPGNAGMKDQIALLRWVQMNIKYFGGNPDDVTISGCSAGGSAIDLHILSKITGGLFKKTIIESGANIASWSVQLDPIKNAKKYAQKFHLDDFEDIQQLEKFYKGAPFSILTAHDAQSSYDSSLTFTPCIERYVGEEIFLDADPLDILENGTYQKLPTLYGFTNMEGKLRLNYFEIWARLMNENFSEFLPESLQFQNEKKKDKIALKVKQFYFGDMQIDNLTVLGYVDYFTDITFRYPMLNSVTLQTNAGNDNIFLYEYSFYDENPTNSGSIFGLPGAGHCDQSFAVLDELNGNPISEDYEKMKSIMKNLWLNFITDGVPVPEGSGLPQWPPVSKKRNPYMSINRILELKGEPYHENYKFWNNIFKKYYRKPIPPTF